MGHNMAAEGGALMARTITKPVVAIEVAPHARPDGFVYVHDVQLEGDENLRLGTRVEVQDEGGNPLPGFASADGVETIGNEIERPVRWKSGTDVSALAGRPVRLRFVMRDARLYAFRFRP